MGPRTKRSPSTPPASSRPRRLGWELAILAILVAAAALRLAGPWSEVFGGAHTNFLETDAWYHLRLVENQVRNFPSALHFDPYASPNGRVVAVAPLLDSVISTAVVLTRGTQAPAAYVAAVAALAPALIGLLAIVGVMVLATLMLDRRAGLAAGAIAAVSPGHFLERTLLGYGDHHALEVLLALATSIALVRCLPRADRRPRELVLGGRVALPVAAAAAGLLLGLYLLTWGSGAYLVAILALWIVLSSVVAGAADAAAAGKSTALCAAIALVIVLVFQTPSLPRYDTQIASLLALLMTSSLLFALAGRPRLRLAVLVGTSVLAVLGLLVLAPDLVGRATVDLARFRPDPMRMAVLETRPLFRYAGSWSWAEPWTLFRSTFYLGLVGLAWLVVDLRRTRRLDHLLVATFTAVTLAATLGQNRFGYYLVPANAVVIGWMVARAVARLGRPVVVFGVFAALALAPGVGAAVSAAGHRRGMPERWAESMGWLRTQTPEPFDSDDHYLAPYQPGAAPARYTVMNWWDQGYWLVQNAHRVPVSDPTQDGAVTAAAFYTSTDAASARAILRGVRARYVLADGSLPFRGSDPGALGGQFQGLLDWAGLPSSRFYELCFARLDEGRPLQPVWIFREAYYATMAFRLAVLGGRAAPPAENAWLVDLRRQRDANGQAFCEIASAQSYPSVDEARTIAARRGAGFEVVGFTPSRTAFPAESVDGLREVHAFGGDGQPAAVVRIFEVTP